MAVRELILDPQISPNLKRRMITSQVLQRKAPRIVLINPEYRRQKDIFVTNDTCDVKFLAYHEMLLTKKNIDSPTNFRNLLLAYELYAKDSGKSRYADAFDKSTIAVFLKLFCAMSKNEEELLGELNFWATKSPNEIIKHVEKANLKKKVSNATDLKRFENLINSFKSPQYQPMFKVNIEMLYEIHEHFISVAKKVEDFDFLSSNKLICTYTSNLQGSSYMQVLINFAMLSKKANVYLDSDTPKNLLEKALMNNFYVSTLVLNNNSNAMFKRTFANLAEDVYISMQEPDFDMLLQKIVQADSDLLRTFKITKKDLLDFIARTPYALLVGNYLVYNPKSNKIYRFTTTNDPLKRVKRKDFSLQELLEYKNKANAKHKVERASKDEPINLPNKDVEGEEIRSMLTEFKSELNDVVKKLDSKAGSSGSSETGSNNELLQLISDKIDDLKKAFANSNKSSDTPAVTKPVNYGVTRDIFGNPEDETDYDIDSAWQDELSKQNPETKNSDPLQKQFMKNKEVKSEMPNTDSDEE